MKNHTFYLKISKDHPFDFLPIIWIFKIFLFGGQNSQAIACSQSAKALSRKRFGFGST